MFTLFSVNVRYLGDSSLAPRVDADRILELSGDLQPNQLYRIMDAGWFGFTRNPDHSDVVLYFKRDDGEGCYLAVTEDGEYRFGRTPGRPMRSDGEGLHLGQFVESSAEWGWLVGSDDGEPTEVVEIPGFIREKLAATA